MKSISLLHPFSAQAIGLLEEDLYHSHSKAQELALQKIQEKHPNYRISIDYFTGKWIPYEKQVTNLKKKFWPVTSPLLRKRHQWRKQESFWHYKHQQQHPAEVTIINMSGHGSKYAFKLADLIQQQGLTYIPMVGGIHMSTHTEAKNYYQNAHHILVHTQVQRKALLQQEGFQDLDIHVLPLGVATTIFKPNLINKEKLSNEFKLLQVGRISRLKQIELSIELLAYLDIKGISCQLDIIGFISDAKYYQELVDLVNLHELQEKVKFMGSLPQEDLVSHYQSAGLLLMPSQHESFGMVMVEAMACGTAVVGLTGAGGTDEIIEHNHNGLLVNKANLQDEVLKLLTDPDQLKSFQTNAITSVQKKWSIETTTSILQNSIVEALSNIE
jgi:glycosyltransferase involved in cell wall biosynthesis